MKFDRPIATAIILFIILLLIFFLVVPEYNTFKKLRADLGEKKAQYNAEFDYYAEITKQYYELQNREEDLKKVDDALPEDPNFGKLIYYFQKTAEENGMIIKDLFLSKSSAGVTSANGSGNRINDLIFSMNLIGDYSALSKFLSALEKSDRMFEVTNISFGSESQSQTIIEPSLPESEATQFQNLQIYNFNLQVKTQSY
ncbi:MAG: type 4a pilus biogenesis protein PilO [Candidatus Staskawiczbacteria bacterium]|nr:type 4a pilus biogenesis protein PilO [Candidatus Staskawiczbacteria bacterium]